MTKKTLYLMLLLCMLTGITYGQGVNFVWAQSIGSGGILDGQDIATDDDGNVYTVGTIVGGADFDTGPGTYNLYSNPRRLFVSKINSSGYFEWAKLVDGATVPMWSKGYHVDVDGAGNVYVTGGYDATGDFDPGPAVFNLTAGGGLINMFILKLDSDGDFIWAKSFDGSYLSHCHQHVVDDAGNMYLTGEFAGTVDFDPGPGVQNLTHTSSIFDGFVLKLDANGDFVWVQPIGGGTSWSTWANAITVDDQGNVYTTGVFDGTMDFDPGPGVSNLSSYGSDDVFIQKLDANGDFVWAKSVGGADLDDALSITLDASNNVLVSGSFLSVADFDPGPNNFNIFATLGDGGFVLKLDNNGDFVWAKGILSTGGTTNLSHDILVDTLNNIFTLGTYTGSYDFDPGTGLHELNSAGGTDSYVLKLDSTGSFAWAGSIGGPSNFEGSLGGTIDRQGNIISTGRYDGTVDFDPGPGVFSHMSINVDLFILKLSACETSVGIAESNTVQQAIAYPNPTSGVVTLDLEDIKDATIKVLNINGQVVYQQAQVNGIHQFELVASPGVYTIEVSTATIRKYVKLVKQ